MHLARIRLVSVSPFADVTFSFGEKGAIVFAGEGMGKTTLLASIAATRPGFATALAARREGPLPPQAIADYVLGADDPERPHPLRVTSPNAVLANETDAQALARRKEQALFDKRALDHGFVLVPFSGARLFTRAPLVLSNPARTTLRYDVRAPAAFDDVSRADLARETKQTLACFSIFTALEPKNAEKPGRFRALDDDLQVVLTTLLEPFEGLYIGVSTRDLEPLFRWNGRTVAFDDLPRGAKHLVAFGALTLRAFAAAHPDHLARQVEGVVLVDEIDAGQSPSVARALPGLFRRAFPRAQILGTTSSRELAATIADDGLVTMRRTESDSVEIVRGDGARLH